MFEALISRWTCIGAVVGLLVAVMLHLLVPADFDIEQLGGWLVALGWAIGLAGDLLFARRRKKE